MAIEELLDNVSNIAKHSNSEKYAIFKNNLGEFNIVRISSSLNKFMFLVSYDLQGNKNGYMYFYVHPNKRLFLDVIYCYDKFRGRGIASNLSNIADYALQIYDGYLIRGSYTPFELLLDSDDKTIIKQEELNIRASNFYKSNGYIIVDYDNFKKNPNSFNKLCEKDDFYLDEEISKYIIVKEVNKKDVHQFKEEHDILINENVLKTDIKVKGLHKNSL